jgi:cell wall-associated NlpC family hydrolase
VTISAVIDVQNRISEIQQRLATLSTGAPPTVGGVLGGTASAGSTSAGASFADDLQAASGQLNALGAPSSAGAGAATTAAGGIGNGATPSGADVVATARQFLGVPYVWGGTDPRTGLDCSGLTQLVYAKLGIDLPRVSWQQAKAGRPVAGMADARPGDLLAFNSPVSHIAIYIGDGKMIEAPRPGKSVQVSEVYERPTAIRRVLPEQASSAAAFRSVGSAATPKAAGPRLGALPAGTPYAAEFRAAEARSGVPARVLAAVAKVESGYRADAVSPAGARGLMQLMPTTARGLGADPMKPASAINGAATLLKRHIHVFGSLELARAAYNAGQGAVRKYGGIPPYAETRNYVAKVTTILRGSTA